MHNIKDFKKELKVLLKKYKADLFFDCSGDTHGITNEKMLVVIDKKENVLNYGYFVDYSNL